MTLTIHNTTDWPFERIAPYGPQITAAMRQMAARYPNEISVEKMAEDLFSGKNQLWLILDGEEFAAFVTSEIKVSENGHKTVFLGELAGRGGVNLVPMIHPIEEWARSIGATEVTPLGREGWRKALAKAGYRPKFVLYSKDLTDG